MAQRKTTTNIIVHCSATRPSQDIGAKTIDEWHRQQGYLSIGYHYVIRRNGVLEPGRPFGEVGAHTQGYNATSIGICLVGGVTEKNTKKAEDNFTPDQMETLRNLLENLKHQYPEAAIIGHRDANPKKACPSFNAKAWAAKLFA